MKPSASTILIILTACVVVGGVLWYVNAQNTAQAPLTASTNNASQAEFQVLVTQLQPITFDTSIFSDPHFLALKDITTQVAPVPLGRLDPFASVGGVRAP
ncbi:hypothetical protein COU19_03145 [Candidatus Kaiserbacteria bacterium CG10_big_fil_rev_8_21_14_0_10_56_12]|uniref:Uncharacterized protein n=1 Tax=Candidatus Kaiserbacteria bacterium CG10_big_fil_rev_8_21_14_0_10_56_12 TaxID=1974611 RepID=A0A2H0UB38_9BACT|nr:MAG: hypothetical protein COU19_03145 [Candidatus Kaiserbacteria bacterium CG10_big_fil_rev_8_21_14_0_10_56_12]